MKKNYSKTNRMNNEMQDVLWKIYVPKLGEKVFIGLKDLKFKATYYVIDIFKNKNKKVVSVVVQSQLGECHTLGILNGEWKIIDPLENRTIKFSKEI